MSPLLRTLPPLALVLWLIGVGLAVANSGQGKPLPKPRETVIKVAAVGDTMFGRYNLKDKYRPFGMNNPFGQVKHLIKGHDLAMLNLETPICAKRYKRPYKGLTFRAQPKAARLLSDAGFNLAITANNHTHDMGDRGVRDTINHLFAAGLGTAGTGFTAKDAWTPYIYSKRGVRVGVLGVTMLRNFPPKERVGFAAFVHRKRIHEQLPPRVKAIRPKVDFLIVSLHFGVEYYQTVPRFDRELVEKLWQAGADVVLGHHPHVMRPLVYQKGRLVFYSLGNFLFDYGFKNVKYTTIFEFSLVKRGPKRTIRDVRFIPVYQDPHRLPRPAKGYYARRVRRNLLRWTRRLKSGTRFVLRGEVLDVLPAP